MTDEPQFPAAPPVAPDDAPPSWSPPGIGDPATANTAPWPPAAGPPPLGSVPPPVAPPSGARAGTAGGIGRLAWAGLGAVIATALIGVGFAIGQAVDDDVAGGSTPLVVAPSGGGGGTAGAVEPATEAAAKVVPAVVLITTRSSSGSGIVYDAQGTIVTNAHVVQSATDDQVRVQFASGRRVDGRVVARDNARDVAVVRVEPSTDLVPAVFAKTSEVRVGQTVIAVGSPFGLEQTVTQGIVSAVGRQVNSFGNCRIDMLQTDAPINPGNSGGALADRLGQVIGMNTSIRTDTGDNAGVGFAVPSDTILATVERMLRGESLEVAFMGVSPASSAVANDGVLVGVVTSGSPADNGGLRSGDLITAVDGATVKVWSEVRTRIQAARVGDVMELRITRDGASQTLRVTLGASPNCRG